MTDLKYKQIQMVKNLSRLLDHCAYLGYSIVLGEAWRSPETCAAYAAEGKGIKNSVHQNRLAIDLIRVDENGEPINDPKAYFALGQKWKSFSQKELPPHGNFAGTPRVVCVWGGDFKSPAPLDPYHFSIQLDNVE